jgi:orotate phosphoribosyltransferase
MYLSKKIKPRNIDINKCIVKSIVSGYKINRHITLSSGRTSDYYYDIKGLLLNNIGWKQIKDILIQDMRHKFPEMVCVAGQGVGGILLAMRISSCLEYNINPIIIRDEQKEYGLLKQVEGCCPNGTPRCVIVDDVMTTGKSFRKTTKILASHGIRVLGNYVLLKRNESHFGCECLVSV